MIRERESSLGSRLDGGSSSAIYPIAALVLAILAAGCSSGGSAAPLPAGLVADLAESGTPAQSNGVRLVEGSTAGDTVMVEVVCGETDRTDVYGFAFDLVLDDPTVAEYVTDSADAGDALGAGVMVTAEQSGSRIVVGVTQTDQTGDKVPGPDSVVVRLALRVLKTGTTAIRFEGSTGANPTNDPTAADVQAQPIGTIVFDAMAATVMGS